MKKRRYQQKLYLDMPFAETLERYADVDPQEVEQLKRKAKKKVPPGGRKKRRPSGGGVVNQKVVRLADKRKPNYR
jgi:hypothetical protein